MVRTERESDSRKREEKWQTCWCCRDQQRACRMAQASAKKLEHTGPAEKERVPQYHRESNWQERWSRFCQKEKEQSRLSRVPDHEGGESQDGRKPHLGEREGEIRARALKRKGTLHREGRQILRSKGRASKKSFPRTSIRNMSG